MDVRNICIMGKTPIRQFYRWMPYPLTHAATDRNLTTILFSFPSVQKKKKKKYQHWVDG